MEEIDYLAEFTANTGLFDQENIAPPAVELLPNRPAQQATGGVFNRFMPQNVVQQKPEISDKEIDEHAENEADWILTQLNFYVGLGKGVISGVIYNADDKRLLQSLTDSGEQNSEEAREILERFEIQKKLDNTGIKDYDTKKRILTKAVKLEMLKKRREGTLVLPTVNEYLFKMVVSEFAQITGNDPKIFSTIGQRLLGFIKSKLPI